jgi:D-alanine-D-alanine ligase
MSNKPNIAVVAGGYSSEIVISVMSGQNVLDAIDREIFTPWLVHLTPDAWQVMKGQQPLATIDKSDFSFQLEGKKVQFDYAYITIHGTPGEDGLLQGYFEMLKIPYSACDVQSSALTFNKWHCSNYLRNFGIPMARTLLMKKGDPIDPEAIVAQLGLPLFVKPNAGGSSFGVTKVKEITGIDKAILHAWTESSEALVDEFIPGTEFTCGLVKVKGQHLLFPVTEVIPKNEFFDFEAKYTPGASDEITPARLPAGLFRECQQQSAFIYDWCGCSGIVRIDYILYGSKFYFLEVNTTPGMTATSFIPQQIRAMGRTLNEILTLVIEEKLKSR